MAFGMTTSNDLFEHIFGLPEQESIPISNPFTSPPGIDFPAVSSFPTAYLPPIETVPVSNPLQTHRNIICRHNVLDTPPVLQRQRAVGIDDTEIIVRRQAAGEPVTPRPLSRILETLTKVVYSDDYPPSLLAYTFRGLHAQLDEYAAEHGAPFGECASVLLEAAMSSHKLSTECMITIARGVLSTLEN